MSTPVFAAELFRACGLLLTAWLCYLGAPACSFAQPAPEADSAAASHGNGQPDTVNGAVEKWVELLGSPDFGRREEASARLLRAGSPAMEALRRASGHSDPEIRLRAKQLLKIIQSEDFRQRLAAFASDQNSRESHGLPGWSIFQQLVGTDRSARLIFVHMQESEPELMTALDLPADQASKICDEHLKREFQVLQQLDRQPDVDTVLAMLLVAGRPGVRVAREWIPFVYSMISQSRLRDVLLDDGRPEREVARRLASVWIAKDDTEWVYVGIKIALQFNLPVGHEAGERALRMLQLSAYDRALAVVAIARFGKPESRDVLRPLLSDTTDLGLQIQLRDKEFRTQMCDVALWGLLILEGKQPQEHGFPHARPHPSFFVDLDTLGFSSQEERAAAQRAWRESPAGRGPR